MLPAALVTFLSAFVPSLPALMPSMRVNFPRFLPCLKGLVATGVLRLDRSSQTEKRAECGRGQYPLLSSHTDLPPIVTPFDEAKLAC